jgi:hypothetical protein
MACSEVEEADKFWLSTVFDFGSSTTTPSPQPTLCSIIGRHEYKIEDDILSRKVVLQHAIREKGRNVVYTSLLQLSNYCTGLQKQILEEDLLWVIHCNTVSNQDDEEGLFQDI